MKVEYKKINDFQNLQVIYLEKNDQLRFYLNIKTI